MKEKPCVSRHHGVYNPKYNDGSFNNVENEGDACMMKAISIHKVFGQNSVYICTEQLEYVRMYTANRHEH